MADDLFVVERLDQYRYICISTLARSTVSESGASHLGGDFGYFIYEVDERLHRGGMHVLAKVASLEAVYRLIDLWRGRECTADQMHHQTKRYTMPMKLVRY